MVISRCQWLMRPSFEAASESSGVAPGDAHAHRRRTLARLTDANRLSFCRPDVAKDWDYRKNHPATPDQFTVSSNTWKWWVCQEGHPSYERKIEQRTRNQPLKCPECPRRRPKPAPQADATPLLTTHLTDTNRLSVCRPDVARAWNYGKNAPHTPDQVSVSSSTRKWWWICNAGLGHSPYEARVSELTRSPHLPRCPDCPRRRKVDARVTDANRLSLQGRDDLIASWNKEANLPLTPDLVSIGSTKRIVWDCLVNPKHLPWKAPIAARAGNANREGTGCPKCAFVRTSRAELRLKAELSLFFSISSEPNDAPINGGPPEEVDIADHTVRLVVEFDGAYYHGRAGSLNRDIRKSRRLRDAGWAVVRVREQDLDKTDPDFDIAVAKDGHPYLVASAVITHLSGLGFIPPYSAQEYLKAGCLQAKELSDDWISDRLGSLVSKAELDTYGDKWDRMHEALVSFQADFGHCRVPYGISIQGVDLRTWCYTQRDFFRKEKLPEDRQRRLTAIPSWTFDARSGRFWAGYEQYQQAFNWQGDGQRNPDADIEPARRWAKKLRERRQNFLAEGRDIPAEQLEAMNAIPGWSWTPRDSRFEEQLGVLTDYCSQLSTTLSGVANLDVWHGHKIGVWISNWRSRRARLTDQQVKALESLPGWTWSKNAHAWNISFAALAAFGKARGHLTPSLTLGDDHERELAKWKHKNRSKLRGQENERAQHLKALLAQYGEKWI